MATQVDGFSSAVQVTKSGGVSHVMPTSRSHVKRTLCCSPA